MKFLNWFNSVVLVGYLTLIVAGVVTLKTIQQWSLTEMSTAESRSQWENWREETVRQSTGDGPVQRRVAKSEEPPMLVLLRDYFSLIAGLLVVIGTLLYGLLVMMVKGAFLTPSVPIGEQVSQVSALVFESREKEPREKESRDRAS